MRVLDWKFLAVSQRRDALRRPAQRDAERVTIATREIIDEVRRNGDAALIELTQRFDGVRLQEWAVSAREFAAAERSLSAAQHAALDAAIAAVHKFHAAQAAAPLRIETSPGVLCERISVRSEEHTSELQSLR